jgi:hypothetical protein
MVCIRVANSNFLHTAKHVQFFSQIGCHAAKHENQSFHNEDDIQNLITHLKIAETVGEGLILKSFSKKVVQLFETPVHSFTLPMQFRNPA